MGECLIRRAAPEDAAQLLDIYRYYVEHTAITFEYDVPSEEEFGKRIRTTLLRYPYLEALQDGKIVGYAYAGVFHDRRAYDWAVETSIYVDAGLRRSGIGSKLYAALEEALKAQHIINLNACISCPEKEDEYLNRNSIQYHEHMGYRMVGQFIKCGYKFGRWYDMVWMEKHIGAHPDRPEEVIPFSRLDLFPRDAQRGGQL